MAKASFYAVQQGRIRGIFGTWDECKAQVDHYPGARYKKFPTRQEAEAFVQGGSTSSLTTATSSLAAPSQKKRAHEQQQHAGDAVSGPSSSTIAGRPIVKASGSLARRRLTPADTASTPSLVHSDVHGASTPPATEDDGVRVIEVYTDGASSNNGQKGAAAGYGVYWPEGDGNAKSDLHGLDVSERLDGELQTNNRAELMALIKAVQICPDKNARLKIFTDSQYSINAINVWQHAWRRNKWKRRSSSKTGGGTTTSAVLNKDLIRRLEHEMAAWIHRPTLVYVKGHNKNHGNERADRLAVAGAAKPAIPREMWVDYEPPDSDEEEERGGAGNRKRQRTVLELWTKAGVSVERARQKAGMAPLSSSPPLPTELQTQAAMQEAALVEADDGDDNDDGIDWTQIDV